MAVMQEFAFKDLLDLTSVEASGDLGGTFSLGHWIIWIRGEMTAVNDEPR